jgi:hypothetical protein
MMPADGPACVLSIEQQSNASVEGKPIDLSATYTGSHSILVHCYASHWQHGRPLKRQDSSQESGNGDRSSWPSACLTHQLCALSLRRKGVTRLFGCRVALGKAGVQ